MERFRLPANEERQVENLTRELGPGVPKYQVLSLALALSLRIEQSLGEEETTVAAPPQGKEGDYRVDLLTGRGRGAAEDRTELLKALLSVHQYGDLRLLQEPPEREPQRTWVGLLRSHLLRGLAEIRRRKPTEQSLAAFLGAELQAELGDRPVAGDLEPDPLGEQVQAALVALKIKAEYRGRQLGPRLVRYLFLLGGPDDVRLLERSSGPLAFQLGRQEEELDLALGLGPRLVGIELVRPRPEWRSPGLTELRTWVRSAPDHSGLPVWPGVSEFGEPFSFRLAQAPHLFVAGTTNSGKSVCLHTLLCSLLLRHPPTALQLCLVDTKLVELTRYAGLPHLRPAEVIVDADRAASELQALVAEMDRRYAELARRGFRNLEEWPSSALPPPRIVVCVEELADLVQQNVEAQLALIRLAQKGRAAGLHLILATQRPDAATFSGLLRSNIPARIALRVQKHSESQIILDQPGAERLLGSGDMLIHGPDGGLQRIQGVFLTAEAIAQVIAEAKQASR